MQMNKEVGQLLYAAESRGRVSALLGKRAKSSRSEHLERKNCD